MSEVRVCVVLRVPREGRTLIPVPGLLWPTCPQSASSRGEFKTRLSGLAYLQKPCTFIKSEIEGFVRGLLSPHVRLSHVSFPTLRARSKGRRVTQVVRNFLHAQKVQPPVELFVDWLAVGHVDEFLSFVPAPDGKVRAEDIPVQASGTGLSSAGQGRPGTPLISSPHTGFPDAAGQSCCLLPALPREAEMGSRQGSPLRGGCRWVTVPCP